MLVQYVITQSLSNYHRVSAFYLLLLRQRILYHFPLFCARILPLHYVNAAGASPLYYLFILFSFI